ncbi:MAG TPA: CpXC domain-containing protein [Thermoanaerobaculia bacterium]|nr:CpXC domain-containing protein [Thermoanaerobaculia bacterium]
MTSGYHGVGHQERELPCRSCGRSISLRVVYFVDLELCPAYASAVRTDWVERNDCRHCGATLRARSPVIVECPGQNLLVFTTHTGDDGGVEQGFRQWLGFVRAVVPDDVYARLLARPYTFVHGWTGLAALFDVFDGKSPVAPMPPYPHEVDDDGFAVEPLDGYAFGPLQFWQPMHRAIQAAVHLLLGVTTQVESVEERQWIVAVLQVVAGQMEDTPHVWLEEEIGRQCLILGERARAREHLRRAQALYHSWIAPTASFLDATPTRRSDGTHAESVASASDAALLQRPVTSIRHTVTALWPHTADYGLWYFPKMAAAAYVHTSESTLRVNGTLIGAILSAIGTSKLPAFRAQPVAVGFHMMLEQTFEIVADGVDELLRAFADGVREGSRDCDYRKSAAAKKALGGWTDLAQLLKRCGLAT